MEKKNPICKWVQNDTQIMFSVYIKNVKEDNILKIHISDQTFEFEYDNYSIHFMFFGFIDPDKTKYTLELEKIIFYFEKYKNIMWHQLTMDDYSITKNWLFIDWEHFWNKEFK